MKENPVDPMAWWDEYCAKHLIVVTEPKITKGDIKLLEELQAGRKKLTYFSGRIWYSEDVQTERGAARFLAAHKAMKYRFRA
jgi:hypothetical protein